MTVSTNSLDDLNFVWDPDVSKNLVRSKELENVDNVRRFDDYLDFLQEMAPFMYCKTENGKLRDIVFEL
jgi:hypothetical protein